MPYLSHARVQETTTTTGTGNITLAGALTNRVTLASVMATSDYLDYVIDDGAGNWEIGIGQLTASTTLVRVAVRFSSNSNALVSFAAGTKNVTLTMNEGQLSAIDDLFFGDGSDGDVSISSGSTALTRDMYYRNLTLSGSGKIQCNGYKVYVSEVLDLSGATNSSGSITFDGSAGNNASVNTGGTAGSSPFVNSQGGGGAGQAGPNGGTAAGTAGTGSSAITGVGGSATGAGGTAGNGSGGSGGVGGSVGALTLYSNRKRYSQLFYRGSTQVRGGAGGGSGGSGGGDGTAGGGGGASGGGGGHLFLAARIINRGGSTAAGAVRANGGNGGNGGAPAGGNRGGGGGGGGGNGGWIQLFYAHLIGSSATNALQSKGGTGGNGGTKTGTGTDGAGGDGGSSGYVTVIDLGTNTSSETGSTTGGGASGTTGGTGATTQVSL